MRVGLVGCVKTKQPAPARAAELYTSPLFVGRRRWVERTCDRWYVLSALHGLLEPGAVIAPYDLTLTDRSNAERAEWSRRVLAQIAEDLGDLRGMVFEVYAGGAYRAHGLLTGLRQRGATVEVPAEGLSQGRQLAFYAGGPNGSAPRPWSDGEQLLEMRQRGPSGPGGVGTSGGAYGPLRCYLEERSPAAIAVTFAQIERILGRRLPASARRHRPWWGNSSVGHSHARAWLDAGYAVVAVDLQSERVTFHSR